MSVISNLINDKPRTKAEIINKLQQILDIEVCNSTIEKDMFCLKMDFDAPIECDRSKAMYYMDEPYSFKEALINWLEI